VARVAVGKSRVGVVHRWPDPLDMRQIPFPATAYTDVAEALKAPGFGVLSGPANGRRGAMVAALGFELSSLIHAVSSAVSSGAGKVAAALVVAGTAYFLFAAAFWLMRSGDARRSDVAGFALITGLMLYVVVGLLMDAVGFAILSAAVIGLGGFAVFVGELRAVAIRMRDHHDRQHAHGH
jgi:hypothetical protein